MSFLSEKCTLKLFDRGVLQRCEPFDCGNEDLNDFFARDSINYSSQLLGKTYCFTLDENPKKIVCAFTVSNDSVKTLDLPNARKKKVSKDIPRSKHMKSYPAVLIGRLGVNIEYQNVSGNPLYIGTQLMDFIKAWFADIGNKTGCRFVVVDSYNEEKPLKYYQRNGFQFVFSSEEQECTYTGITPGSLLKTRLLYYDLIKIISD